jgi:diaminohydroxyphosphoribosylaminopyrimidine deaminase/5-amino-6-(5-phosphoribosylamino)uracil reductase
MMDEIYMQRCIDLALLGSGMVSPNPMVGAVLVYNSTIIGEGWHREYGGPHAEVNCINSVREEHKNLIPQSTLYVSLEPCAHFGKTPPCADLVISQHIPKVVIGCVDSFSEVSGKGIEKLKNAGITVITGVMENECRILNKRFFTRQEHNRPYVILKWAESVDGFIAPVNGKRVMLSNTFSQTWVHKMRSEEDAILVGYNTAVQDNPQLNNRYGKGLQPIRTILDYDASLPQNLHIFDGKQPTIILNYKEKKEAVNVQWKRMEASVNLAKEVLQHLPKTINSIIIEGGSKTLQHFIDSDLWDEAALIKTKHSMGSGIAAPTFRYGKIINEIELIEDKITIYQNANARKLS